jgi:esterase/lipase superfamily enzyme
VFLSSQRSGYNISIIGFSWDSDIEWDAAKKMANENEYLLAGFIKEFKNKCPTDNLRIIAHSLGSRVTLSAIQSLYDNHPLETVSKVITT